MDALVSVGKIFEVNTGAISRGWRTAPYPSRWALEQLKRRSARVTISSDSHLSLIHIWLMEKRRLDSMTNPIEHPLWYPMEFDQILEEFALADHPAMEIWPAEPENSGALEAMLQALYLSLIHI